MNLEQINRTRAELEALVKDHPELCQGAGTWADNIEELREMVTTPGKERMARYRKNQQQQGLKAVTVYLSPEAQQVLGRIMEENPGVTMGEVISKVLTKTKVKKVERKERNKN